MSRRGKHASNSPRQQALRIIHVLHRLELLRLVPLLLSPASKMPLLFFPSDDSEMLPELDEEP